MRRKFNRQLITDDAPPNFTFGLVQRNRVPELAVQLQPWVIVGILPNYYIRVLNLVSWSVDTIVGGIIRLKETVSYIATWK